MKFHTKRGRRLARLMRARASQPRVGDEAPDDRLLARYVRAAANVPDHGGLRPWRLVTIRGGQREALGQAIADASGDRRPSTKPLRAPLLVAVVVSLRPDRYRKAPEWEQLAVAVEVAHGLQLLLAADGWGSMWRSGRIVETDVVRAFHGLAESERLLGWLYVGSLPERPKTAHRHALPDTALRPVEDVARAD